MLHTQRDEWTQSLTVQECLNQTRNKSNQSQISQKHIRLIQLLTMQTTYWALIIMTTVGYGDVYPVSQIEQVFIIMCMIIACGFSQLIVKLMNINDFMIHSHIPNDFRYKIKGISHTSYITKKNQNLRKKTYLTYQ
eukprot:403344731